MNQSQYNAEAAAAWILRRLQVENDVAREGLPSLDPEHFFRVLAGSGVFPQASYSIALAGFGIPAAELERLAHSCGLEGLRAVADDLHIAAGWRNRPTDHPRTIALASGYYSGVHTLGHFGKPESVELATELLERVARQKASDPQVPEVHARLLDEIRTSPDLEILRSLEVCTAFLSEWDRLMPSHGNQAPCLALPALGLFSDPGLFEASHLEDRLRLNLSMVGQIKQMRTSALARLEKRASAYHDAIRRQEILDAVATVRRFLTDPGDNAVPSLTQAVSVARPPKDEEPPPESGDDSPEPEPDSKPERWETVSAVSLLEGREDDLQAISEAIDTAWEEFEPNTNDPLPLAVNLPSGATLEGKIELDLADLDWVQSFCNEETWGGLIETDESKLALALQQAADGNPISVRPLRMVTIEGESFGMRDLLVGWDEDLGDASPGLVGVWEEWCAIRVELLPHLPKLLFHAREWLDGKPAILTKIQRYLELAAVLYRGVQENYRVMEENSPAWALFTAEALLSLDVLQVRVRLPSGEYAAKAVLLPTHPLHLWRNERLSCLLRGLAKTVDLAEPDRKVIIESLRRPEQFLSVIRLGSLPDGKGLGQLLPLADQIHGLPVFENLINACSGLDGAESLGEAIDQFILLHPNHPFPLRIAVVNPPRPEALLARLVKVLNDPRYRGGQRLSGIHVELFATAKHTDRLRAALTFTDSRYEDIVQEKVASGRLVLHIHEIDPPDATLERIVNRIELRPVHLVAIFDESTIHIRRRSAGRLLPMSPFCVRQDLKLDRRTAMIEVQPQPGESPFSEFLLLMSEIENTQRDTTPYAFADAESLAQTTDALLQPDASAARWLFLADRALPSEGGMRSVKIWERREGQRDTFLAARDFATLARLLRPVFSDCNLTVTPSTMAILLHQGARLLGSGLLEIIKKQDGKPDQNRVVGFVGLILAARDFLRRQPDSLVLSVDHPIARLWLRSGTKIPDDRCDLVVLRKDDASFVITSVEVKSSLADRLSDESARLRHAEEQALATLDALADGLEAAAGNMQSPLSIPRCEMLKLALVRAAQARTSDPAADRQNRKRWGEWLTALFPSDGALRPAVTLEACVVSVPLKKAHRVADRISNPRADQSILHRTLTAQDAEEFIDAEAATVSPSENETTVIEQECSTIDDDTSTATDSRKLPDEKMVSGSAEIFQAYQPISAVTLESCMDEENWPPPVNAFGMIGQYEAVERLVEQALYAKSTGRRFSDKLLVGPAGVGKSTLARNIAGTLLGREHLFFSGSSLKRPVEIIERLQSEGLVADQPDSQPVPIAPALLFIDEVHGISNQVETMLLSAMDDARITTINNVNYDFSNVIFLLATTDPGRLSEAFQSRPNKTWLRPYTLDELAGIIWLHGKEEMEGIELTRDACYEIAARNQCNPRRSVRELTQVILPHFFSRASKAGSVATGYENVASLISADSIAEFYDKQGIDLNGLDYTAQRFLKYLKQHGSASEPTLRKFLALPHVNDFVEVAEYLTRLRLIETGPGGRRLTRDGICYLRDDCPPDLRDRISRGNLPRTSA